MKGVISMSLKETERIAIMDNLIAKRIKQKHAAKQIGVSVRQIQRILERYRQYGVNGLVHRSRGRKGNRALSQKKKERIAGLIKTHYPDFGPTLACEKLHEVHNISVSDETTRTIMTAEHLDSKEKEGRKYSSLSGETCLSWRTCPVRRVIPPLV